MSISGITCGAQEEIREAVAAIQEKFEEALHTLEPNCDADAVASEAREVQLEAHDAGEAITELQDFLADYLADMRGVEEKAERLADDADSRYYGPEEEEN